MIDSIHQSTLNMAFRCGEQFRRRYIENEILPPGIAAGRGTGVHAANEANMKYKIIEKKDLPISDMKDAARDGYVKAFSNGVYLSKDDIPEKDKLLNDGLNDTLTLTELYGNEVAPSIKPKEVEREFTLDIGLPIPLAGKIDIEETNTVHDLKTAKKSWSNGQINKEIQPLFYSLVHEKETGVRPEFIYSILVALKTPKLQVQSITPTDKMYEALYNKLNVFCAMLQAGTFLPANPASWWCDPKWCGYYYSCKYVS